MSKKLTIDYVKAHMGKNEKVYLEAGKLLTDAILNDTISYIEKNGETEKIVLKPTIEVQAFQDICIQFCYQDSSGNTICYHREL